MTSKFCFSLGLLLAGLGASHAGLTITDDFNDNIRNPEIWNAPVIAGSGPSLVEANGRVEVVIPAWSSGSEINAAYTTTTFVNGDFDQRVDYSLLDWPAQNGIRVGIGVAISFGASTSRISFGVGDVGSGEVYLTHFSDGVHAITPTADRAGSLRMVREGNIYSGYYWSAAVSQWVLLHTGPGPSGAAQLAIAVWSTGAYFNDQTVRVAFDNYSAAIDDGSTKPPHVPVPEPSTWVGGVLLALPFCFAAVRRRSAGSRRS